MQQILEKLKVLNWRFVIKGVIAVILLIPVVVVIAFAPLINRPLYNRFVSHPAKYPIGSTWNQKACGITPENVYFKSDNGNKLNGLIYKLAGAKRIALISHGNSGNILQRAFLAEKLLNNDCSVFAYDYSGYGRSEGETSIEGMAQDGDGAYKYLLSQNYKPEQIILFGESIGTLVSGELARRHESAAVILECPLYSLRAIACKMLPYLQIYPEWLWLTPGTHFDNSSAFKNQHPPLLLIAGTADHLTPIEQSDQLFAAVSQPKQMIRIDGASHGDKVMMSSPLYKQGLAEFMKSLN